MSPTIMSLVRKLFFIAATHHFNIRFLHIQGTNNGIADALSLVTIHLSQVCLKYIRDEKAVGKS